MGVSIEEYRQRIGCFARVLSSFKVRGNNNILFQKQSKDFGTALRVIIRLGCLLLLVAAVIQSSPSILDLTQFGDVEKNPGPQTDSVGQSTSQLVKEPCTVSDLHPLLRQRICQRLDIKHSTGEGYRKLAAYFDMTSNDIITISQNPNPTDNVLRWVGYKPKNTIAKLRDVLQTMGREDCVKIIDEGRPLGLVVGEEKNKLDDIKERTEKTERIAKSPKRELVPTEKKMDEITKKFKMDESLVRQEAEGIPKPSFKTYSNKESNSFEFASIVKQKTEENKFFWTVTIPAGADALSYN